MYIYKKNTSECKLDGGCRIAGNGETVIHNQSVYFFFLKILSRLSFDRRHFVCVLLNDDILIGTVSIEF